MRYDIPFRFVALLAAATVSVPAADVSFFGVLKSKQSLQTNSGAPVTLPTNAYAFNAFVYAAGDNLVTNATVRRTGTDNLYTLLPDFGGAVLRYEFRTNSQSGLDAAFPNGSIFSPVNYTVTMDTVNDGTRSASLNFTLLSLLGSPPTLPVSNVAAAQSIDSGADFTLCWDASGGQLIDIVQVVVSNTAGDVVYASPPPLTTGALTGTSNSVVIPAFTLPAGTSLSGHLAVIRPVGIETNAYPGAVGLAGVLRDTEFPMGTRPAPLQPTLSVVSSNAAPFQLSLAGETNRNYHIQATTDFLAWQDLFVTNLPLTSGQFTDTNASTFEQRFYRIQVGP